MEKCPDEEKKRELLKMMPEEKRKQLLQILERKKIKAIKGEPVKAIEHKRTKYENIKIANFVQQLYDLELTEAHFAEEVQNYF
jgi:NADH dehydrogenase FAD-containing subunit